jgi:chromosome segregation ATPase
MRKYLLRCFVLGLLAFSSRNATAQQPAEQINAYVFGVRAEQAEAAGKLNEARDFYEESLRLYQETARLHPEWTPSVVQYRMTATANQLERIKGMLEAERKKKLAEEAAEIQAQLDQAVADARVVWLEEKNALDQRIAGLTAERAALQESGRATQTELTNTRELIAELERTIQTREKRIKRLEEGRDDAKVQTEALRADMATKDGLIAQLQEQVANVPPPLVTPEELELLRRELADRTAEVAGLQANMTAMTEQMNGVSADLARLQAEKQEMLTAHETDVRARQQAADDLLQQIAANEQTIADLRNQLTSQPPPLISADELDALRADFAARTSEHAAMQETIAKLEAQVAGSADEQAGAMEKVKASHEKEIARTEKKLAKLESSSAEAKETIKELERAVSEQTAERERLEKQLAEVPAQVITPEGLDELMAERDARTLEVEAMADQIATLKAAAEAADLRLLALQQEVEQLTRALAEASAAAPAPLIAEADLEALRNEHAARADEITAQRTRIEALEKSAADQLARQQALEAELATASQALTAARQDLARFSGSASMAAAYEKSEVENIVFRNTIQALSNQLAAVSAQATASAELLAREQKSWNSERAQLTDRMNALMETVDLNQAEISRVKELRTTIKNLEKENRRMAKKLGDDDVAAPDGK